MNLLRAQVRKTKPGTPHEWWEMSLLDLAIVADGASEQAVLEDLSHSLVVEYHLAVKAGLTPFVSIFRACPSEVRQTWDEDGGKSLRHLKLPMNVRMALAAVFHSPMTSDFGVRDITVAAA